jgi:hypothetical protein
MKKIYIAPETQVVKVELQQMIAESINKSDTTTKGFDQSLSREGGLIWELEEVNDEE